MLYNLFASHDGILNVLRYTSFRAGAALIFSIIFSMILGNYLIPVFRRLQGKGQTIREDGPQSHLKKQGTPTMGGFIFIITFLLSSLLFADLTNPFVWIALAVTTGFFLVGFADDYLVVKKRSAKGLSAKLRLLAEFAIVGSAVYAIQALLPFNLQSEVLFPFFKNFSLDLGIFFIVFASVVVVGTSNAVNITDGLDGLATLVSINVISVMAIFAFLLGRVDYSNYLHFQYIPYASELLILSFSFIGGLIGFYWYNSKPAQIFMGDCGSLAIGGFLGIISVMLKSEFVLAIAGAVFIAEITSSVLQRVYFKITKGKRLFKMAPLHHHFELSGWAEEKIVARFWIISFFFCMVALLSIKLR